MPHRSEDDLIACDAGALPADAAAVDALARLALGARRTRRRIGLRNVSDELMRLLWLVGLHDVLLDAPELGREPIRQAEEREQPRRVQERVDRDDRSS